MFPSPWSAWRCLLILTAVLVIYAPALAGGWFWDDSALIVNNTDLRTFSGLRSIWAFYADWPLSATAFWIEWHLFGRFPFGYHAVNIALHTANAFLVWKVFSRLGLRWAWLGGLLFAVHPLAVESVAWASELKNTLSLFFSLLSLLGWMDLQEAKGSYLRALLFYTIALLAKTSGLMMPAVFLLYAWWKNGAITARDLKRTIPFWLIALALGLITVHFQSDASAESAAIHARGMVERCTLSIIAFNFYLSKFLWPAPLMPIYPPPHTLAELLTFPLTVFLATGLPSFRQRGWYRHVLLGVGFFAPAILPVLGLADMNYLKFSLVADRFSYLPMIGLIGLAVAGLETISRRIGPILRLVFVVTITLLAVTLAWTAHTYAARFADEQKMWAYNIQLNPSAWAAHNNLGFALLQSGRVPEARREFETALSLNPNSADAHNNLGVALMQAGQDAASLREFDTALRLDPDNPSAQQNRQEVLGKVRPDER